MDELTQAVLEMITCMDCTASRLRAIANDKRLSEASKLRYLGELVQTCLNAVDLRDLLIAQSNYEDRQSECEGPG